MKWFLLFIGSVSLFFGSVVLWPSFGFWILVNLAASFGIDIEGLDFQRSEAFGITVKKISRVERDRSLFIENLSLKYSLPKSLSVKASEVELHFFKPERIFIKDELSKLSRQKSPDLGGFSLNIEIEQVLIKMSASSEPILMRNFVVNELKATGPRFSAGEVHAEGENVEVAFMNSNLDRERRLSVNFGFEHFQDIEPTAVYQLERNFELSNFTLFD